jgi:hypothetical protein
MASAAASALYTAVVASINDGSSLFTLLTLALIG